jgi:hypothetical protein
MLAPIPHHARIVRTMGVFSDIINPSLQDDVKEALDTFSFDFTFKRMSLSWP